MPFRCNTGCTCSGRERECAVRGKRIATLTTLAAQKNKHQPGTCKLYVRFMYRQKRLRGGQSKGCFSSVVPCATQALPRPCGYTLRLVERNVWAAASLNLSHARFRTFVVPRRRRALEQASTTTVGDAKWITRPLDRCSKLSHSTRSNKECRSRTGCVVGKI